MKPYTKAKRALSCTIAVALLLLCGCSAGKRDATGAVIAKQPPVATQQEAKEIVTELDIEYDENSVLPPVGTEQMSNLFHYHYVYDLSYLDGALGYTSVDEATLVQTIQGNPDISDGFKALLTTYVSAVSTRYPDADLRVLYENLKTLKIHECTQRELIQTSLSFDSLGVYMKNENAIYVLKDCDYLPNTWPYQVIFHEISHAAKSGHWTRDGTEIRVSFDANHDCGITVEALNSIFAVSLYHPEEKDIAYQLQSKYHLLMLQCLDNYTLTDYINRDYTYFLKCLDDYNGDQNYAAYILQLITAQYDDFHDDAQLIKQSEFYPIYDYLLGMYFSKYIDPEMSCAQAKAVADKVIADITFDVPEAYALDVEYMYRFFEAHCKALGMDATQ